MTSDSTSRPAVRKPRPDFPLFPHATGRWAKKVRGKLHYFGKTVDDPKGEAALNSWLDQKDDLLAGRTPRVKGEGLTVGELCDRFLQAKDMQLDAGEITQLTRNDYKATTDRLVAAFGKSRLVRDLASDDFEALKAGVAKTRGPVATGNEIQRIRVVFKYGFDAGLIDTPIRYGPTFKRPSKKVLRLARAAKGPRMLEAEAIRRLITVADVQLEAMILLGVNCGLGNSDVGTLPLAALDLNGGWLTYHRPKTGIDRRCPLWPETVRALKVALAKRPAPKTPEAKPLVFVTKYGAPWAKETFDNPVTKEFRKLLGKVGVHRAGLGFYTLRHVFRTIADESRDQPAVNSIMGHADASMAAVYRERIGDDRLQAVADHVRGWLFGSKPAKADQPAKAKVARAERPVAKSEPRRQRPSGGTVAATPLLRIVG